MEREKRGGKSYYKFQPPAFKETEKITINILPYKVSIDNHPDRVPGDEGSTIAAKGDWWYRLGFRIHRNVGPGKSSIVCPSTFGGRCPLCEERERLNKDGVEWKDMPIELKTSLRYLYYVQVLNHKQYEDSTAYLWDISEYSFQKKLTTEVSDDVESYENFPDPTSEGLTLVVRFTEESIGKNQKFLKADGIKFLEREEDIPEELYANLAPLESILLISPYNEIKALWNGEEEEEYTPAKASHKKAHKSSNSEDDEDEDEAVFEEADDEEEAPRPKKSLKQVAGKKKKRKEAEDIDEDIPF
jgi:hypothetical protein